MTKQVQRRRGTASQHTSFTGAEGEISVNTTNKSVHVHDGVTAGGVEAARADLANVSDASLNTALAGNTLSSLTITSADINGGTIDGTVIGGTTPAAVTATSLTATGTTTLAGASTTADITFGDNDKAIFGAGSDLEIFHNGTTSYIRDVGEGDLQIFATDDVFIRGYATNNYMARFAETGAVTLYHNNAAKFATTSTGVDVTGTVTADGLDADGIVTITDGNVRLDLMESDATDLNGRLQNTGGVLQIRTLNDAKTSAKNRIDINHSTGDISFYEDTGTTPKFFWDASAEALGIGTASPSAPLDVVGSPGTLAEFRDGTAANFIIETSGAVTTIGNQAGSSQLAFKSSNSEAMRIDASGNLLVAGTSATLGSGGIQLNASGRIGAAASSLSPMVLNRTTSDGTIMDFRKDGTTVGSIGTDGGDVYIGTGDTTLKFVDGADLIAPTGTDAATRDGVISLGNSSNRFNDLYLSGGVYLGGTGSNNYLDDYEHGIYTVTITPATSGTVTLDTVEDSGTYVKIGNLVHVSAKIEVASVSSPVGTAFISLPFAIANVNENSGRISGSVAVQNIAFTGDYLTAFGLEGNSHFQLQQVVSNGTWVALSASALGSGDDIQFTFTYRTTD